MSNIMYPKNPTANIIIGTNSQKKSRYDLKYRAFTPFRRIPNIIWVIPIITDLRGGRERRRGRAEERGERGKEESKNAEKLHHSMNARSRREN
jgi:hypothetical protein